MVQPALGGFEVSVTRLHFGQYQHHFGGAEQVEGVVLAAGSRRKVVVLDAVGGTGHVGGDREVTAQITFLVGSDQFAAGGDGIATVQFRGAEEEGVAVTVGRIELQVEYLVFQVGYCRQVVVRANRGQSGGAGSVVVAPYQVYTGNERVGCGGVHSQREGVEVAGGEGGVVQDLVVDRTCGALGHVELLTDADRRGQDQWYLTPPLHELEVGNGPPQPCFGQVIVAGRFVQRRVFDAGQYGQQVVGGVDHVVPVGPDGRHGSVRRQYVEVVELGPGGEGPHPVGVVAEVQRQREKTIEGQSSVLQFVVYPGPGGRGPLGVGDGLVEGNSVDGGNGVERKGVAGNRGGRYREDGQGAK